MSSGVALRTSPVPLGGPPSRSARIFGSRSPLRKMDWLLNAAVVLLAVVGGLLIWSATKVKEIEAHGDPTAYLKRHLLNLAIGLVLGGLTAMIDHRALRAYTPVVWGASVLGLLAVLAVGSTINGAHSWIVLPAGFQLQPSEFAKVALVLALAVILGEKHEDSRFGVVTEPGNRDVLIVLAVAAVPMALIMLQPDFGTMMVFVFVILGMLAVAGAPRRWVVGLVAAGVLFGGAILQFHLLAPYQEARLTQFVRSDNDNSATGYNVDQAKTANASGGLLGKGLFHGTQTQGQFVPEQQTDFVFTVAGEELGLLGAGGILAVLAFVMWRTLRIAGRAADSFGALVCTGVVCWFTFQSFVNVGMTLGIMPVTGLPLPFLSYGGSSMFANMIAIGLVQNVRIRSLADPYAL